MPNCLVGPSECEVKFSSQEIRYGPRENECMVSMATAYMILEIGGAGGGGGGGWGKAYKFNHI